jgi:hypothetical protein
MVGLPRASPFVADRAKAGDTRTGHGAATTDQ